VDQKTILSLTKPVSNKHCNAGPANTLALFFLCYTFAIIDNNSKIPPMGKAVKKKTIVSRFKQSLLILLLLAIGWHAYIYVQVATWRSKNPQTTAFMRSTLSEMQKKHANAKLRQHWVDYKQISPYLKQAVIASEDARFTRHNGFDWEGIRVAMEKNIARGRIAAGGSTISQQLAKNLFLSGDRSFLRKAEEAIITAMIELTLSKKRIFELYLNYAEWGNGIFGADAASHHYYGIPASELSRWQAATMASMLPNPRYYDGRNTRWLDEKSDIIMERMPKVQTPH